MSRMSNSSMDIEKETREEWMVIDVEILRDIESLKTLVSELSHTVQCQSEAIENLQSEISRLKHSKYGGSSNSLISLNTLRSISSYLQSIKDITSISSTALPIIYMLLR